MTYLVLNECDGVLHELDSGLSMHTYSKHAKNSRWQSIVEAESAARPVLHVEADRFEPAHVEERFVLDAAEARMVQEVAEHEAARLSRRRQMCLLLLCYCSNYCIIFFSVVV